MKFLLDKYGSISSIRECWPGQQRAGALCVPLAAAEQSPWQPFPLAWWRLSLELCVDFCTVASAGQQQSPFQSSASICWGSVNGCREVFYWTQVQRLTSPKSTLKRQVLAGKKRLLYPGGQPLGEKAGSSPKGSSPLPIMGKSFWRGVSGVYRRERAACRATQRAQIIIS